jgi:hypothetical protein
MATQASTANDTPRNLWKSTGAILLGFVVVFALSLGTDQIFHSLGIYPPWGEVMQGTGLFVLALGYRLVYQILGGYLVARFAPRNPTRHVWVFAFIGLGLSILGAIANAVGSLGPNWYPIALAVSALPSAWVGGLLYVRGGAASRASIRSA